MKKFLLGALFGAVVLFLLFALLPPNYPHDGYVYGGSMNEEELERHCGISDPLNAELNMKKLSILFEKSNAYSKSNLYKRAGLLEIGPIKLFASDALIVEKGEWVILHSRSDQFFRVQAKTGLWLIPNDIPNELAACFYQ